MFMLGPSSRKRTQTSAGYVTGAVAFDGAADYGTKATDLTGNADSKFGIVSLWFNVQGGAGTTRRIYHANNGFFRILLNTSNIIEIAGVNGTTQLEVTSGSSFASAGWHHLLAWWDMADTGKRGLYIDGADDSPTWTNYSNSTIDYTRTDHAVGAAGGADFWNGYLSDMYLNFAEWVDLSVQANREKFILGGKPVNLGTDGSTPTGTAPIIYFHIDSGASAPTFLTDNKGTGGDFTDVAVITTAPSSPSD